MPFKPAPRIRKPAVPMKPLIDPAGWTAEELGVSTDWVYELSAAEQDDIRGAVALVEKRGLSILDITRDDFPLPDFDSGLEALYDELLEGRGFFLMRGLERNERCCRFENHTRRGVVDRCRYVAAARHSRPLR